MATYVPLGSRQNTAAKDGSGLNPGNLTNAFTPAVLALNVSVAQAYHISITGVPAGAVATIKTNNEVWGFTAPGLAGSASAGAGSEVDYPSGGILITPGDEIDFLWSVASSTTPLPVVTLWLRYDIDIPANRSVSR